MADDDDDLYPDLERIKKLTEDPRYQQNQHGAPRREYTRTGDPKKDAILELNEDHFTIYLNGRFKVVRENPDGTLEIMDKKDLVAGYSDRRIMIMPTEGGDPKYVPITDVWFASSERRHYKYGFDFDPSYLGNRNDKYNLWKGYRIESKEGDVIPFLDLMNNIICCGNVDNFNYLIALISQMFQEPHLKPAIAVVIRGDEGVGKSFFVEKLSELMRPYTFKTSNPAYIFGDHNGQLKNCILLHLEEAVWAGSKKDESLLKDIISGPTLPINDKYVPVYEVPNHLHLFITGNPEWLVSAGFKARRIFALHASEDKRRDTKYFAQLDNWFKNGGNAALMHYFLNHKYDIDLRIAPVTEELIFQKQQSMNGVQEWLYSIVDSKEMPYGELMDGKVQVIKALLLNDYNHSPAGKRHQLSERKFGRQLADLIPDMVVENIKIRDSRDNRRNGYEVPLCPDVRRSLESKLGGKVQWSTEDGQWSVLRGNTDFDFSLYKPDA
jgi:hypothetical protein